MMICHSQNWKKHFLLKSKKPCQCTDWCQWCTSCCEVRIDTLIQSNLAISNSVNSKSPLFRRKIECPWIYPSPLRFPGYFEAPLFRTFFHFPWDFKIAGFDCSFKGKTKFFLILSCQGKVITIILFPWKREILLLGCYKKCNCVCFVIAESFYCQESQQQARDNP